MHYKTAVRLVTLCGVLGAGTVITLPRCWWLGSGVSSAEIRSCLGKPLDRNCDRELYQGLFLPAPLMA